MSPVICVLRIKVPLLITVTAGLHVLPLSVEKLSTRAPEPTLKSFQETYIRPKNGELGLLSAQPDTRSSPPLLCTQKWDQLFGSSGVVALYLARVQPPFTSTHTIH